MKAGVLASYPWRLLCEKLRLEPGYKATGVHVMVLYALNTSTMKQTMRLMKGKERSTQNIQK